MAHRVSQFIILPLLFLPKQMQNVFFYGSNSQDHFGLTALIMTVPSDFVISLESTAYEELGSQSVFIPETLITQPGTTWAQERVTSKPMKSLSPGSGSKDLFFLQIVVDEWISEK